MVCQGYKAPDTIDPKLLDPKFALEEVEEDLGTSTDKITSLKKLLNTKKAHKEGYDKAINQTTLFAECDFKEFLTSSDPHEYLGGYNKFTMSDETKQMLEGVKLPSDMDTICEDIRVCGRREYSELLRIRLKYIHKIESKNKEEKAKIRQEKIQNAPPKTQEELEEEVDKELEATIQRVQKMKKREAKKEREREAKQDVRNKMSVIAASTINNDEELLLD